MGLITASNYMKQKLTELQGEIEKPPNYICYFNLNACHTITEKEVWRLSNPVHSFYCMRDMGPKEVH